jgi:hypothetical protein
MSSIPTVDDFVAQGFTRVQAIKKVYETIKQRKSETGNSQRTEELLEVRKFTLRDSKNFIQFVDLGKKSI